jgi:hypothetical protein
MRAIHFAFLKKLDHPDKPSDDEVVSDLRERSLFLASEAATVVQSNIAICL